MNQKLEYLREKTKKLPLEPGVYIMKDRNGKIIYIGKARELKKRVSSYFRNLSKHHPKVMRMVENADDFEYIVTGSEFEALVLEASMIKQHRPKYNILLKDDKGYHYIKIGPGGYPRLSAEKQKLKDGSVYLGPYTSSFVVKETVDEANKAFMLPVCGKRFPEDFGKGRPCLNYHIKQCMGVCTGKIRQADYEEAVEQAVGFIQGNSAATIQLLTEKMEEAAEQMHFERAARYRDRIAAIGRIQERQHVVFTKAPDQDVIAIVQNEQESCAVVLKFRNRKLVDKEDYQLGEIGDLSGARREFLLGYYSGEREIPRQISLDGECDDRELVERYLGEKSGRKLLLHVPERGEQLRLVRMAANNAAQQMAHRVERTGRELAALDHLTRLLGLSKTPTYIEAYDISNMGGGTIVGGMVVFENGRPLRNAYRKFNIKTVAGADDYASMREVISRRLARYQEEKESGEGFGRLPDLILLDGGKGHVSAVLPLIEENNLTIPVFGMVKDDKHRTRAIAGDGGEISIIASRSAFSLVTCIQDEVHRFAISHMKSRHKKTAFELTLTKAPGIGAKRAQALYKHFKTAKAIRAASVPELAGAEGMNGKSAQALYGFLHGEEN